MSKFCHSLPLKALLTVSGGSAWPVLDPTSSTDLPWAVWTLVLAVPSAEMVKRSLFHSMVAGGLDITSQLMFTGLPSHE